MPNETHMDETIEEMIKNGTLHSMTEAAYGSAVADEEKKDTLHKD